MDVPFFRPTLSDDTLRYARDAVESVFWSGGIGPYFNGLQCRLRNMYSRKYCILTNSGTSACRAAIAAAMKMRPDREYLVAPSYSCSANIIPAMEFRKKVKFTMTDEHGCPKFTSWGTGYRDVVATFVPYIYGSIPKTLDSFVEACQESESYLVTDISQAVGIEEQHVKGDIIVGSLRTEKLLGCGEGGFLLTDDDDLFRHAYAFCNRGKIDEDLQYVCSGYGDNLLMSGVSAAIAIGQLECLGEVIREKIFSHHRYILSGMFNGWARVVNSPFGIPWQTAIISEFYLASDIITILKKHNIDCRPGFYPLPNIFYKNTGCFPAIDTGAKKFWYHAVIFPTPHKLTNAEFNYIKEVVTTTLQ